MRPFPRITASIVFGVAAIVAPATRAQVIERLADIETGNGPQVSSFPAGFFNFESAALPNGAVVFAANDPEHGRELWLSTGSSAVLVRDVEPGPVGSSPSRPIAFDGRVWFTATTSDAGAELWVTDGTTTGTRRVADVLVGAASSAAAAFAVAGAPSRLLVSARDADGLALHAIAAGTTAMTRIASGVTWCSGGSVARAATLGSTAYFAGSVDGIDCELYASDGTAAGTALFVEIAAGATNGDPQRFTRVGARLFFVGNEAATGREPWVTDGTVGGTHRVADLSPGAASSDAQGFVARGDDLVFASRDANATFRLRRTDGTTVTTILPVPAFTASGEAIAFGNEACIAGNDGTTGVELWCTDGTDVGTRRVIDLTAGAGGSNPSAFVVATIAGAPRLFYTVSNPASGLTRLVATDGTAVGTIVLTPTGVGSSSAFFAAAGGGQVLGSVGDAANDRELWRSDGTVAGTGLLADIGRAPGGSLMTMPIVTDSGEHAYFAAFSTATGYELWRTDATPAGTARVIDLAPGATSGIVVSSGFVALDVPDRALPFGERLLFMATDGTTGDEAWITDGTDVGTVKLIDTIAGNNTTGPAQFGVRGDFAYFLGRASVGVSTLTRLFRTDGTAPGTSELATPANLRFLGSWMRAGSHLYIAAQIGSAAPQLYRVNDAGDGVVLIGDVAPGVAAGTFSGGVDVGGALVFVASTATTGAELFRSDGTAAGTDIVVDLVGPGFLSSVESLRSFDTAFGSRRNAVVFGSRVLYACDPSGLQRFEPCVSDGTAAGTALLADLQPGDASSVPLEGVADATGDRAYFIAGANGPRAVFVTDGTNGATSLSETVAITPTDLAQLPGGELVMSGNLAPGGSDFGRELFAGLPGAIRGFNLAPGELSASPTNIRRVGDFAIFRANVGATGNEPHVYKPDPVFRDGVE